MRLRTLLAALVTGASSADLTAQLPAEGSRRIDSIVASVMQSRRIPGAAVAVVDNGRIVFSNAYGLANLETETPVTPSSVFELASVTKPLTAAAVMLLVQDGKVRLDDSITTYFDQPPDAWQGITVRQLLTHTAGLQSGAVVDHQGSPLLFISTKQAYEMIAARPLFLPPGTHGFYADAGYFLLGMIIERASGMTYRQFMHQRIFDPLQMTKSSVLDKRRVLRGRVATYEFEGDQLVNWRRDWQYELPSFFGVFSTVGDLVTWSTALHRRTLLADSTLQAMWTPAALDGFGHAMVIGELYGLGFTLGDVRGHRTAGHSGASGTYILHLVDAPITVIVLTNLSGTAGRHAQLLARSIAGVAYPRYRPPDEPGPQGRIDSAVTAALRALLPEFAAGRTSDFMTEAHKKYFNDMPAQFRNRQNAPLGAVTTLTPYACDDTRGRGIRYTDDVAQICYYRGDRADGPPLYVTTYLTAGGRLAHLVFATN